MFCEECGTKNKKGTAFCENCGHQLQDAKETTIEKEVVVKERKPMSKKTKVLLSIVGVLVVAFIAAYMYLGSLFTPEKIALKYFKAYASKDANALYDTLTLDESKFVSKKILKDKLKDQDKIKLSNYSIVKEDTEKDSLTASVTIKYINEDSKDRTKKIKLVKNKKNKYLFFDNWTVDSSELIAKDYTVNVPADSTLKIDGISVSDKYKTDSYSSRYDAYKIPNILKGKYTVTAELKSGIILEGTINVNGNYGSSSSSNLKLDSKSSAKLEKDLKEKIELMYKSAIDDKSFEDIEKEFDEDYKDDIEYRYSSIRSNAQSSYNTLKSFNLNKIEIKSTSFDEDKITLDITIKYDYKVEYGYSESDKKEYSKKNQTDTYVTATYVLKNKKYVMTDITSLPSYFSHYSY